MANEFLFSFIIRNNSALLACIIRNHLYNLKILEIVDLECFCVSEKMAISSPSNQVFYSSEAFLFNDLLHECMWI